MDLVLREIAHQVVEIVENTTNQYDAKDQVLEFLEKHYNEN